MNPKLETEICKEREPSTPVVNPNKTLIAMPARLQIAIAMASGMCGQETIGMYTSAILARWALLQADALIEEYNSGKKYQEDGEGGLKELSLSLLTSNTVDDRIGKKDG